MATATPPQTVMTAEEFAQRPDPGYPEELVKGRIIRMPPPGFRHGEVCIEVAWVMRGFLEQHDLGRMIGNDAGVVTGRAPDSVRGADLSYYSYNRVSKGSSPAVYPGVVPELVFEIRSPSERWPKLLEKVAEYLNAGVSVVCVLDPDTRTAQVFDAERPVRVVGEGDELTFPDLLPGFGVLTRRFFE